MTCLTLSLLGGFQVRLATGQLVTLPTKKTQAMMAYLALQPGGVTRERLATLLWGNTADEQAHKSLRQALYLLRTTLPATQPPSLLMDGKTIALNPAAVAVDVADFERLLRKGTPKALERAAVLYRGDLLEGFKVSEAAVEEWLMAERERLHERALEGLAKLLAHQWKAGETERAMRTAARLLAYDPAQEAVHRVLMRCYARQGRRGAAVRQYQACVTALQRELGSEPDEETKRLCQDIIQQRSFEPPKADPGHRPEPQRVPFDDLLDAPFTREAPLIGRESELERLREALDRALDGHGHAVAVVGEAGIGKSSILMALAAEAHAHDVRILLGRSYQSEQVLAFSPWVEALRSGHVVAAAEVLDNLTPLWRVELARLLPELRGAGGDPPSDPSSQRRLFEAATELVRSLAAKEPVLVMLEDLHWADEMSGRLVAFLARRIASSRVLVVVTIRDEELASSPVLGDVIDELRREPHFIHLPLAPLTRADTIALVQRLTRATAWAGDAAGLYERIWRLSEGNPFMVVETIQAVLAGTPPQRPLELPLPGSVRRVVAERFECLSARGRRLVAVAAVIGREFDFALVQRAAGLDEREAAEDVEELVRRRVLHGLGARFDFVHERFREVAYSQLLQPRRQMLHVRVAKALEELCAGDLEPHYAVLAGHYRAAEVWEKALLYLRQAGAGAMRLSAHREAVVCFEQALEAVARLPKTRETLEAAIDLRFDLRNALLPLAEPDKIRGYLQDAESLARTLGDQRRLGWASVYMSHYYRMAGHPTGATRLAASAHSLGETLGDSSLRTGAEFYLGAACFSLGDYRYAADLFQRIVRSPDDGTNPWALHQPGFLAVLARAWLAQSLAELGEFEEGIACGEEGIRLAEALDHPMSLAYACTRLGHLHAVQGNLDRAALLLERSRELTCDWKITFTAAIVTADLGHVYALLGRLDAGLSLLRAAIDAYECMKVEPVKARLLIHLGEACLLAERLEDAIACARRSLAHTRARGERGYEAYSLRLLAEIASHRDPPDVGAAENDYRAAITLAAELGMRPLTAHCHHGFGRLYGRAERRDAARERLAAAARMFHQMNMGSWLKKAEAELTAAS